MKVLHAVNTYPGLHRRTGGGEQACRRLIENLAKNDVENHLITTAPDIPGAAAGPEVTQAKGMESFCGPLKKYVEVLKWYIFQNDPLVRLKARKLIEKEKPDVVHLHNMYLLTFAVARAAKDRGIPVCLSIYDYWFFCPLSTLLDKKGKPCRRFHGRHCAGCLPPVMNRAQRFLLTFRPKSFRRALSLVDRFIVLSDSSRKILRAYGIEDSRIATVPVPLPSELAAGVPALENGKDESPGVLFVGWMQRRKGLHVVLNAMEMVWQVVPKARLTVITQDVKWENEYRDAMKTRLSSLDKERLLFLSGPRARGEIERGLREASVVVIPEQWENMSPLLLMEAMCMGKAVVASDIGGIPEFIEDGETGLLAAFDDSLSFACQIIRLLKDRSEAARIGEKARERIRSIAANGKPEEQTMEVYRRLCAPR